MSLFDDTVKLSKTLGLGHVASSLSTVDIIEVLFNEILTPDDVFILSKGHGCYAYYCALLGEKHATEEVRWGQMSGCAERGPYIPCSTGSLGMGLPIAVGIAWAKKIKKEKGRVFCLCGDGEMQEGSNWEAMTIATSQWLGNLTLMIDENKLQAMCSTIKIDQAYIQNKLRSFGFDNYTAEGHVKTNIYKALKCNNRDNKPIVITFRTTKGKGISEIEGKAEWHYRALPKNKQ